MTRLYRMSAFSQFAGSRLLELILKVKSTCEGVFKSFLWHYDFFLRWLGHYCLMLFALSLALESNDKVQSSAHILVVKVGSCLGVLILSTGVVIEVDSFVIIVV